MSDKRHLPVLGATEEPGVPGRPTLVSILVPAIACVVLYLPLGMLGVTAMRWLHGKLPPGTSPAAWPLAISPLLLSFALASFLSVILTMRPKVGTCAAGPPLVSALVAVLLVVALVQIVGIRASLGQSVVVALVLFGSSVPAVLGAVRFGRRIP